ncbi:MAG: hypothetical protein Q9210_000507 [Variospora velana]
MPLIHFGSGNVGEGAFATVEDVGGLLDTLATCGIKTIDTAGVYPLSAPGASERLLGAAKASDRGFTLNTKILMTGDGPGQGSLRKEAINESFQRSLTVLGLPKVDVLYCHQPDTVTPVEETAAALHHHWSKENFMQIGLSNYSATQVEDFLSKCDLHGWKKPTVYQGHYNALCRRMENDLLPLLRRHNITYVAFSPLAGGFLTGNFSLGNDLKGTRYAEGNFMGALYRPLYDKPTMHAAIRKLHAFLQPREITLAEAALRWVFYHSALGPYDAVIIGATKREQVERNVSQMGKGPLSEEIVDMFEKVWEEVKDCAP